MIRRRTLAGLVAGILTISCASQIAATQPVHAADSYDMNISVNLNGEKKAISPYIYGVNEYGTICAMSPLVRYDRAEIATQATTGRQTTPTPVTTGSTAQIPTSVTIPTAPATQQDGFRRAARSTMFRTR